MRGDARILIDDQKLFFVITPSRPVRQARRVRIAGLGEVGPVGLQQLGKRRIVGVRGKPAPFAVVQTAEYVRHFQAVERPQFGLSLTRNRAIKAIYEDMLAGGMGQARHRADRAGANQVIGGCVQTGILVQ